jgi:hypothetical protein
MAKEARVARKDELMSNICRFVIVCIAIDLLTCTTRLCAEESQQEIDPTNIIERFDATRDGVGHLLLPVTVHNKNFLFCLDTGAAGVLYDSSFRSILGKPKKTEKGITDAGNVELEHFNSPDASLGKLSLKTTSDVVIYDLSRMRKWSGVDFYGLIGMSFLKQHILRIDFDKGEVLFLKTPGRNPGRAFPLSFQHGVIHTEALIPGRSGKEIFAIDTGDDTNYSGSIRLDAFKSLCNGHTTRHYSGSREKSTMAGEIKPTLFR